MFEIFDLTTGETLHKIRSQSEARETLRDMNEPWIGEVDNDKMYGMRFV